jgi:hypothetical protein
MSLSAVNPLYLEVELTISVLSSLLYSSLEVAISCLSLISSQGHDISVIRKYQTLSDVNLRLTCLMIRRCYGDEIALL